MASREVREYTNLNDARGGRMDRTVEREGERDAQLTFTMLKPLCTQLLEVSSTSQEDRGMVLDALQNVLKNVPAAGLQRCLDYVLFPLLLLLDAAVAGRSSNDLHEMDFTAKNQVVRVGDRVAEGVLSCVEVILQRCFLETTAQVTMLLQKMTSAAMLSPKEAAEEFRHGVVKCLQALLQNLRPCHNATCLCKLTSPSPFLGLKQNPLAFFGESAIGRTDSEKHTEVANICPLGYLQSESMSAAIGHLISLLFQIAEAEAARGTVGSGKLRQHALFTLRTLVLRVGTADGLAFFLPGVVSGFAKVIHSSRSSQGNFRSSIPTALVHTSGAAGWPPALEEAVRGLTEILVIVLGDEKNNGSSEKDSLDKREDVTATAALETLQGLSVQLHSAGKEKSLSGQTAVSEISKSKESTTQGKQQIMVTVSANQAAKGAASLPLRSPRTKEWLDLASSRIHILLTQTFPLLCVHQSPAVRLAVTEATAVLLATCGSTLKICTTLFLECLLALACDDWEHVASAAQTYLTLIFTPLGKDQLLRNNVKIMDVHDKEKTFHTSLVKIFSSMLDQLPRVVFSSDISMSVLHARRLTAAMYFLGPDGVSSHLLDTSASKQKFIQILSLCLSFNTTFTGSLEQITSGKPILSGPIISELKSGDQGDHSESPDQKRTDTASRRVELNIKAQDLPTMPPWLSLGSGSKLYCALVYVLRLAGLSAVTDQNRGASLVSLMDLLLVHVRQAASTVSTYGNDITLEERISSGQEQRMAATSVCVLNEILYGASGAWNEKLFHEFGDHMLFKSLQNQLAKNVWTREVQHSTTEQKNSIQDLELGKSEVFIPFQFVQARWQAAHKDEVRKILSDCAGSILHDYLSPEVWDQPTDLASASFANSAALDDLPSVHYFHDNIMLQKVLVDAVGVLGIALENAFEECGYLGLVLFPLLEKLASPSQHIQSAAAVVLNTLCSHCEYASVRELVVANVDLVIDSLCRQFRHLTMYPNAPNLLAAILRQTNVSADLLPLLEEPLRGIVLELDVLSRRNHPRFTVPLLRALREITRATRVEAGSLLKKAKNASLSCKSLLEEARVAKQETSGAEKEHGNVITDGDLEELVNEFTDRQRCRRAVAAIATSCLDACGPLLASKDPKPCLLALDAVEDGITTLSQAEHCSVHESKEKEFVQQLCNLVGFVSESDCLASVSNNNDAEPKTLLPSMNRVWPHLVLCLRHAHPSVVVRAVAVIASITIECGGDFFTRRFQKDAVPVLMTLLREGSSLAQTKKLKSPGLLLPLSRTRSQESAPAAVFKVQEGILEGITKIAATQKSASALLGSFGLVAARVVLIACHIGALQEVATNALLALSKLDPDCVWIFVMDMVYGSSTEFNGATPTGFPSFHQIFPPCESPRDALCIKYAAYEGDLTNFSKSAAQNLLTRLERSELA